MQFPSVFEDLFQRAVTRRSKAEKLSQDAIEYYRNKHGQEKIEEPPVQPVVNTDIFGSKSRVSVIIEESRKMTQGKLSLKQVEETDELESFSDTSSSS